jgi:hypothetical protein
MSDDNDTVPRYMYDQLKVAYQRQRDRNRELRQQRDLLRAALGHQQQEPVATVEIVVPHLESIVIKHIVGAPFPTVGSLLYTTPPRREWQSLTDEEVMQMTRAECVDMRWPSTALNIARTVEAALKERNHG